MPDTTQAQLERLKQQIVAFEEQYGWTTPEFYPRFERGELGDDMDFIEWAATWEMIQNFIQAEAQTNNGGIS